jgi:hypothetical protein
MDNECSYMGFNIGKVVIGMLRVLKQRGLVEEAEILEVLWDAKDPLFPWNKQEIKELIKL